MPTFSIIIPTYQHAHYVVQAVDSVLAQTFQDYEIIVIDDGSTDDTREKLVPYFGRIHYIYQINQGLSFARNTGIEASVGEFIAFLDADDLWVPEKLSLQISVMEKNPGVGLVYGDMYYLNKGKVLPNTAFNFLTPQRGRVAPCLFAGNFITMPTVVVRKKCLGQIKWFNPVLTSCEDYDAWFRIALDFPVDFIKQPLAYYRIGPGQMSSNQIRLLENNLKFKESLLNEKPYLYELLSTDELNRGYYKQILKLSLVYLRERKTVQARNLMKRYLQKNGVNSLYRLS